MDRRSLLKASVLGTGGLFAGQSGLSTARAADKGPADPYDPVRAAAPGKVEMIYYRAVSPTKASGQRTDPGPPNPRTLRENGLVIDKDRAVALRDGVKIYVDVFRADGPAGAGKLPALLAWSPYGKHSHLSIPSAATGVKPEWCSPYTGVEAPDPAYWGPAGYALIYVDPRGSWYSEGDMHHFGKQEASDAYDLIEWIGVQDWCNGKVGMAGVSYLSEIQFFTAGLRPPHLAAINPWEGGGDFYRHSYYHGGIPSTQGKNRYLGLAREENFDANAAPRRLIDAYWADKEPDYANINVPAYVVASWGDHGKHTRDSIDGYARISSPQKWLEVHGRKLWEYYYDPESRERQKQFFDHFLKGADTPFPKRPKVWMEARERRGVGAFHAESEWPPQRTRYRELFLDARDQTMAVTLPAAEADVRYDSLDPKAEAQFVHIFDRPVELSGYWALRLWVEPTHSDDMDLFVAVEKLDTAGKRVPFTFYTVYEDGPVGLGWLRASHQELDEAASTPYLPIHKHTRERPLKPGQPIAVDIEIWPCSATFAAGEALQLRVKGVDIYVRNASPTVLTPVHDETRNEGTHIIRTGGRYNSRLLVPELPKA